MYLLDLYWMRNGLVRLSYSLDFLNNPIIGPIQLNLEISKQIQSNCNRISHPGS